MSNYLVLDLSPKAAAEMEKCQALWESAMETVPGFLRNKLNMHQLQSMPLVSEDANNGFARVKSQKWYDKNSPIQHVMSYIDGNWKHSYWQATAVKKHAPTELECATQELRDAFRRINEMQKQREEMRKLISDMLPYVRECPAEILTTANSLLDPYNDPENS